MAWLENRWNVAQLLKYDKTTQCIAIHVVWRRKNITCACTSNLWPKHYYMDAVEPRLKAKLSEIENCIPASVTPEVLSFVLMYELGFPWEERVLHSVHHVFEDKLCVYSKTWCHTGKL